MKVTRREFGTLALGSIASAGLGSSRRTAQVRGQAGRGLVNGVRLGVMTYSFRGLPRGGSDSAYLDDVIQACVTVGAVEVELMARVTLQPLGDRDAIRQWRLTTPPAFYEETRKKFTAAGLNLFSYTNTYSPDLTDAEIEKIFEAGKAMRVEFLPWTMGQVETAKRLVPLASSFRIKVAFHNSPRAADPAEVASPDSFRRVLDLSPNFFINLDIGHYTAADFDAVKGLEEFHERISHIHLKDRKLGRNGGANLPWGEGDTPIKPVLTMIRDRKWPLRALAEYEHNGTGTSLEEVNRCMEYARRMLA